MEFDEILQKRQSTRAFKLDHIEQEKLDRILQAAQSAPSAGNLQAYKIVVIKDNQIKQKLVQAALNQDFIAQAPVVLVFLADPQQSASSYGQRGEELYCLQDATLAAIFAWLKAIDEGLSTCWVGAFDENQVRHILKVSEDLRPVIILPIGVANEQPKQKSRRPKEEIILTPRYIDISKYRGKRIDL